MSAPSLVWPWAAAREQDRARRAATETRWAEEEAARQEASKKSTSEVCDAELLAAVIMTVPQRPSRPRQEPGD